MAPALDHSLTCIINGLEQNPTLVTWKDPDGMVVSSKDSNNYQLSPGLILDGTQKAILTIKPHKMTEFVERQMKSFQYTCSVRSSLYPGSPQSPDVAIVTNILTIGKCRFVTIRTSAI